MDELSIALLFLDGRGRILNANSAWENLTQLKYSQIHGKSWLDLVSAHQRAFEKKAWDNFLAQAEKNTYETVYTLDLPQQFLTLKQICQKSPQGLTAFVWAQDSHQTTTQLTQELQNKLAAVYKSSNQVIMILDKNHRVLDFNAVAANTVKLRFGHELKVGYDFGILVQADRMDDFQTSFAQALKGQSVFKVRDIRAPDQQTYTYEMAYTPILNEKGEIHAICFTALNIEQEKLIQTQLHEERTFISSVLNSANALIFVTDVQGRIVRMNKACEILSERKFADLKGEVFWQVLTDGQGHESEYYSASVMGQALFPKDYQSRWISASGKKRLIHWSNSFMHNLSGEIAYIVSVGVDMTELKNTEQALQESEELLRQTQKLDAVGQMAGGIAHDFNNMLTAIQGYVSLLGDKLDLEDVPLSTEANHPVNLYHEIIKVLEKARALTQQLLLFSRRNEPQSIRFNLNTRISELHQFFQQLVGTQVEIELDLADELGDIHCDPIHLEQLLMNLIVNSRDALPTGGVIQIRTHAYSLKEALYTPLFGWKEPGDYLALEIKDNGLGIPAKIRHQIFNPFFTTKKGQKNSGSGLGLAIVYGIIKQYGGFIELETSEQGTCFRSCLPLAPAIRPTQKLKTRSRGKVVLYGLFDAEIRLLRLAFQAIQLDVHILPNSEPPVWEGQQTVALVAPLLKHPFLSPDLTSLLANSPEILRFFIADYSDAEMACLEKLLPNEQVFFRPLDSQEIRFKLQHILGEKQPSSTN